MPEMPEFVENFAWATETEAWFGCTYERNGLEHPRDSKGNPVSIDGKSVCETSWNVGDGPSHVEVLPDLESPEWRQAVMDGLIAKFGYGISIEHSGEPMTPITARDASGLPIVWEVELLGEHTDGPGSPYRRLLGYGESVTLNAALNAACTQARKAEGSG